MNIPSLSTNLASAGLAQVIQISMLKKTMDQMEQVSEQFTEMLEAAEIPSSSTIDIRV